MGGFFYLGPIWEGSTQRTTLRVIQLTEHIQAECNATVRVAKNKTTGAVYC